MTSVIARVHVHKVPYTYEIMQRMRTDTCNVDIQPPYSKYEIAHAQPRVTYEFPYIAWRRSARKTGTRVEQFDFGILWNPDTIWSVQAGSDDNDALWSIGDMRLIRPADTDPEDKAVVATTQYAGAFKCSSSGIVHTHRTKAVSVVYSHPVSLLLPVCVSFVDGTAPNTTLWVVAAVQVSLDQFVIWKFAADAAKGSITCSQAIAVVPIATVAVNNANGMHQLVALHAHGANVFSPTGKTDATVPEQPPPLLVPSKTPTTVPEQPPPPLLVASKNTTVPEQPPPPQSFYSVSPNDYESFRRFRWVASVINPLTGAHICGGSLIGSRHVLTAKHCLRIGVHPAVRLGGSRLDDLREFDEHAVVRVIEYHAADACLLELDMPVAITPVAVNGNPNQPAPGSPVTAVGWGHAGERERDRVLSRVLAQVSMRLQDIDTCKAAANADAVYEMCAGAPGLVGGKDACSGDSGGPLVYASDPKNPNTHVVVGITSRGTGCAREGKAGVWCRVSALMPWISTHVPDAVVAADLPTFNGVQAHHHFVTGAESRTIAVGKHEQPADPSLPMWVWVVAATLAGFAIAYMLLRR